MNTFKLIDNCQQVYVIPDESQYKMLFTLISVP